MKHLFAFLFVMLSVAASFAAETRPSKHLVLALDGVPHTWFEKLREKGMFQGFLKPSRMIAPFPSVSNYSWAQVLHTNKIPGYNLVHYSAQINKIAGDPMKEAATLSIDNKFDFVNENIPYHLKSYVASYDTFARELKKFEKVLLASADSDENFYAYFIEPDAFGHMRHFEGFLKSMQVVDKSIVRLRKIFREKLGKDLEITIVSDHGQETKENIKSVHNSLTELLKRNAFSAADQIDGVNDVLFIDSGMVSSFPIWMKNERKAELAGLISKQEWADHVTYRDEKSGSYVVSNPRGRIEFTYDSDAKTYTVRGLTGSDPLRLLQNGVEQGIAISELDAFQLSLKTDFPNSLERIRKGLSTGVMNPAAILVGLKSGFIKGNAIFNVAQKMTYTTHGSLNAVQSIGVLVSTLKESPDWIPADQIYKHIAGYDFPNRFHDITLYFDGVKTWRTRLSKKILNSPTAQHIRLEVFESGERVVGLTTEFKKQADANASFLDIDVSNLVETLTAKNPARKKSVLKVTLLDDVGKKLEELKIKLDIPNTYSHTTADF